MTEFTGKRCGNCGSEMKFLRRENLLDLHHGLIAYGIPNLFADRLDAEFWGCPNCRKLDLYTCEIPEEKQTAPTGRGQESGDSMAQTVCPSCGAEHDLDDPKCPRCGAKNPNI